ncbi:MAG: V-type ATP synthase subunit I [Clostridia bacterium]
MAIIPMKRLTLVGLKNEQDILLGGFSKLGCVHIMKTEGIDLAIRENDVEKKELFSEKMDLVTKSMKFIATSLEHKQKSLKQSGNKKKITVKLNTPRFEVAYDDFSQTGRDEFSLFGRVIDTVQSLSEREKLLSDEKNRLQILSKQLLPYANFDMPFNKAVDTNNTSFILGKAPLMNSDKYQNLVNTFTEAEFEIISDTAEPTIAVICLKEQKQSIMSELSKYNFVSCPFDFNITAKDKLKEIKTTLKDINNEEDSIYARASEFKEYIAQLKVLYDFYYVDLQKTNIDEDALYTKQTYILKAWFPTDDEQKIKDLIERLGITTTIEIDEPTQDAGDLPPTKIKNGKFAAPFAFVTDMYSVPNYWEEDPNRYVGIWFTFLFGMMLGDVGYGFLLVVLGLLAIKIMKPEQSMRNLITILVYGGVSTIFWGVMYGGWFSIEWFSERPLLVDPLADPIAMMGLSIGIGMLHLSMGYILKAKADFKNHKPLDAIFGSLIWIVVYVGVALLLLSYFGNVQGIADIGMYILLGSLAVILLTNGRNKKGFFGKVIGGFGGLYNVINLMSDALSYLRLFGLGLATGIIGWVFNLLAGMIMNSPVGYIFGIIILIAGHSLNLAVNVLGSFVHDMRLQHVEFFGKFYTGEGIAFKPFANDTKYIRFNNDKKNVKNQ